jgi:hypothetical protein
LGNWGRVCNINSKRGMNACVFVCAWAVACMFVCLCEEGLLGAFSFNKKNMYFFMLLKKYILLLLLLLIIIIIMKT